MAKIRVYELARELKLESKALLIKMKDLGISVAGHQSALTPAQVEKIKAAETAGVKPKVVVRRRKKANEPPAVETAAVVDPAGGSSSESVIEASVTVEEDRVVPAKEPVAVKADREPIVSSAPVETLEKEPVSETQPSLMTHVDPVAASKTELDDSPVVSDPVVEVSSEAESVKNDSHVVDLNVDTAEKSREPAAEEQKANPPILTRSYTPKEPQARTDAEKLQEEAEQAKLAAEQRGASKRHSSRRTNRDDSNQASSDDTAKSAAVKGATIVRRATEKEVEETRSREEARQKTSRREDSRGVRVTGIGVSTRMGAGGNTNNKAAPNRPSTPSRNSSASSSSHSKASTSDIVAAPASDEPRDKWSSKEAPRRGNERGRVRGDSEEEKSVSKPVPTVAKRRGTLSTRELLDVASRVESGVELPNIPSRKRRTVYMPQGGHRKRDVRRRKDLKTTQITTPRAAYRVVRVDGGQITVADFAHQMSVKGSELIKKLMSQGLMVTINQHVDLETATLLASDFGYEVKDVSKKVDNVLATFAASRGKKSSRAPIITVMGHVDHGKTSILDAIRKTDVASLEAGGITQHIGAYSIDHGDSTMTFLDTPGHEAFSAMRARGAMVTDVVVLVVAADDGVMPQTLEAISHAKNAEVPIIVAVNKIDKQGQNLDRIYTELAEQGVQSEEWGGDIQFVKVSALKREGIDQLLDAIQLQAEVLELEAPTEGMAEGAIVEAHLEKGRGPVATLIVTAGQLQVGDFVVAGAVSGRIRAMSDHTHTRIEKAGPSMPVEVVGLAAVPMAGDRINAVPDEKSCRELVEIFEANNSDLGESKSVISSLEDLLGKVQNSELPEVPVIIKADTQGSCEAIAESLNKLNENKKVRCLIIHKAVGGVNTSDINLSETSRAVILAFNVRAARGLEDDAERRGIVVRYFSIIYELIDVVRSLMAGMLPPDTTEVVQGHAEVRDAISVPKIGMIAGSSVLDGKITRKSHLRLIRNEVVIFDGKVSSLRRFKDDVKEVTHGYECGISIDGYNDVKIGDMIEAYHIEETAATLEL